MQSQRDETLKTLLSDLYRDDSSVDLEKLSSQLLQILSESSADDDVPISSSRWREDDVVLITYANTVADDAVFGLQSLRRLVNRHLEPFARVIHVLPFLKSTSDGGFAVSSYQKIEQEYGDWSDLSALADGRRLIADLVLNHVSASHPWVQQFLRNEQPGESCVLEASPDPCWNDVVRPRSSALFTQLSGPNGRR